MVRMTSPNSSLAPQGARSFPTTCWTIVLNAGNQPSPESGEALEHLCRAYWPPLYAFIRFFHSGQVNPVGVNWSHYRDAEMDRLLDAATTSFDTAEQDRLMARAHEKAVNEALLVFVVHDTNPRALGRNVRGYTQAQHWFQDLSTLS